MARSTDDMIRELSRDLPPVTPMRRLREVALMTLGISLPFCVYRLATSGLNDSMAGIESPSVVFTLVLAILVLVAIGGLVAALAGAIPGREKTSRLGLRLCLVALAVATSALGYALAFEPTPFVEIAKSSVGCALGAAMLAVPAALFVTRFVVRGAADRISTATGLATAGGMGAAAAVVHASCPHPEALHLVMGHGFAPFAGGLVVLTGVSIYFAIKRSGPSLDEGV